MMEALFLWQDLVFFVTASVCFPVCHALDASHASDWLIFQDPRGFQEARKNRGNRGVGGAFARPASPAGAVPGRRAQATVEDCGPHQVEVP